MHCEGKLKLRPHSISHQRVRVTRSLVLHVRFVDRCLSFCSFSFGHCVPVLLRYTDSDCPFGIFKLFFFICKLRVLVYMMGTIDRTVYSYLPEYMISLPGLKQHFFFFFELLCFVFRFVFLYCSLHWYFAFKYVNLNQPF